MAVRERERERKREKKLSIPKKSTALALNIAESMNRGSADVIINEHSNQPVFI